MSTRTPSHHSHFDNLSYISDGRDQISYNFNPHPTPSDESTREKNRRLILQPQSNFIYAYQTGHDQLRGYNNPAFSDVTGANSRGPSIRTVYENKNFDDSNSNSKGKARRIFVKYWYVFAATTVIVLAAIGTAIGLALVRSKEKHVDQCSMTCELSEKLIQINSTYCECHFVHQCDFYPPVCGSFPCVKLDGNDYECNCSAGFQHPPNTHNLTVCQDIDECLLPNSCRQNEICNNTDGSFFCSCRPGFEMIATADGFVCGDQNECVDGTKCSNGQCVNTNGSFYCRCNPGFIIDPFHPIHCEDVDECLAFENCTNENEICENTIGSFRCVCDRGYRRDTNGSCINIDECAESNSICDNNSRCEDRPGSFACCMTNFTDRCIECGFHYSDSNRSGRSIRQKRLVGGEDVRPGDFPWVAALLVKSIYYNYEPRFVCSASLISSWNLITAAHCLDEQHFRKNWELTNPPSLFKDIFEIHIGVRNLSSKSVEFLQSRSYSIANFSLHADYQSLANVDAVVKNDIAVIRLSQRVQRSSTNDWICLPFGVDLRDQNVLKVVSYQHDDEESIEKQITLRVLNNPQTQSECQRELTELADDAFCARSLTNSSYLSLGDSGAGAMIRNDQNFWQLAGLMSKRGLLQPTFSAMTNVSAHLVWLKSQIER